jgi:DNA repair protein RadA/Sms
MARTPATLYRCDNCDYEQVRFFGVCPSCKEGIGYEVDITRPSERANVAVPRGSVPAASFRDLAEVSATEHDRTSTGISELDRVLGGGLVPGSYIILAGVPGAGKTTIATQAIISLAAADVKVAYVSGEESEAQARMRFERLGVNFGAYPLPITTEASVERVCEAIEASAYDFVVVDSIQTMMSEGHSGRPGSVGQVAECGDRLRRTAKETGTTILLVGQVTKDGDMAGPRLLEHMVDVVLQFEGERDEQLRVLRAVKNRFGSTDEIGVFEMTGHGLEGIPDPSKLFLSERDTTLAGSAVCAVLEGTRIVLCEIQALVRPSNSPMPMRQVAGIDAKRLSMLLAVMSQAGYLTGAHDVLRAGDWRPKNHGTSSRPRCLCGLSLSV